MPWSQGETLAPGGVRGIGRICDKTSLIALQCPVSVQLAMTDYDLLIEQLVSVFDTRLKCALLFGSRARGDYGSHSDHDIFLVIESLPGEPLDRRRVLASATLPVLTRIPEGIRIIAKTPAEVDANLTPMLLDICIDGKCLWGESFWNPYRERALAALHSSGMQRHKIDGGFFWAFPTAITANWELDWSGFHERP
jgi:hypothetical protein